MTDRRYVAEQYRNADNLNARIALHRRFSTNPYGWLHWVFDQLRLPPRCRILELGCGPGDLWRENQDRSPEGWSILLSDYSPGMTRQAMRSLAGRAGQRIFCVIDAQAVPLEEASFDAVIADHMLYHIPDRDRALAEIRRVLKPGGRLYASTIGRNHLRELGELVNRFDPNLAAWGWRSPDSFLLESGAAQLEPRFRQVELRRYEDSLIITESAPLVDYLLSSRMKPLIETPKRFSEFIERELEKCGGTLHVTKESGIFTALR
jgi:SAM-dependent methyltransferase